jgi:hypothetical protein
MNEVIEMKLETKKFQGDYQTEDIFFIGTKHKLKRNLKNYLHSVMRSEQKSLSRKAMEESIMTNVNRREKMEQLRQRAAAIKADPKLRHEPNSHDLRVASENAKLMAYPQYQTIKVEKGE